MSKTNKLEVKEKVSKVALEMILKYGLKGLNMIELANECGLAKATLYKIIGSKEELIYQIAIKIYEINTSTLEPLLSNDDPLSATQEFLERYLNYGVKMQRSLVLQIYKEYPLIEQELEANVNTKIEKIVCVFQAWQSQKKVREDVNVEFCIESMIALNDFYIFSDYSDDEIIERLRSAFRCILNGIGILV